LSVAIFSCKGTNNLPIKQIFMVFIWWIARFFVFLQARMPKQATEIPYLQTDKN